VRSCAFENAFPQLLSLGGSGAARQLAYVVG
jgi:hypothetical protein